VTELLVVAVVVNKERRPTPGVFSGNKPVVAEG